MYTVERLLHKISPLEDKEYTQKILPLLQAADFKQYERKYKGQLCVVMSPSEFWNMLFPGTEYNMHELTVLGRSLQALLWERSYLRGSLIFTKPLSEVDSDGF